MSFKLPREQRYQEIEPESQRSLKIRGNTVDEMERFIGSFKLYLMEVYDVGILEDMDGPVSRNVIDKEMRTWQVRSLYCQPIENNNSNWYELSESLAMRFIGTVPEVDPETFGMKSKCKTKYFAFYCVRHEIAVDPATFKPVWGLQVLGQNLW